MNYTYKTPKTLDEMIQHLKNSKNIVFNDISEENAKTILYKYNYINVITPFKYKYAKNEKGKLIKDSKNNHIYLKEVEFSQYYSHYLKERTNYHIIYHNIIVFETMFNSILSYELITNYNLIDTNQLKALILQLKNNNTILKDNLNKVKSINRVFDKIIKETNEIKNIYNYLDNLTLNQAYTIYRFIDKEIKLKIFKYLSEVDMTFNRTRFNQFENILRNVINIRNTVCHGNSIEILKRYYDKKEKSLRSKTEYKIYENLIELLETRKPQL